MDELLDDFVAETSERLLALDAALLRLERAPADAAEVSIIFRLVHTIKGTCGFLDLPRLEALSHAAEEVLGGVRDGTVAVTAELVSHVLAGLDGIKAIVTGLAATGREPPGDDARLIADLTAWSLSAPSPPGHASPAAPAPAAEPARGVMPAEPAPGVVAAEPAPGVVAAEPAPASTGGNTIRVAVEIVEGLMTLVSELVLTRNQLLQLARSDGDQRYTVPLQRLSLLTSDLQEGVMKTRMQPIGLAWNGLPRLVRDLSQSLAKPIELRMSGDDVELDRQIIELVRDPLTHMVRNAADHGLESPSVRRAAGKPAAGIIRLHACHEGGQIIIEVADDGGGLSMDGIKRRALAQGLATEPELAAMTVRQVQSFVFRPGFSTAAAVTAISGRGVGLDVVRTNIERIGGSVNVASVTGQGTTWTIKIPLTLAIISALIVEARGERFAIPQKAVVELVRTRRQPPGGRPSAAAIDGDRDADGVSGLPVVERINGTAVLRLRDRLLPLVHLADVLQLGSPAGGAIPDGVCTIVVVAMGSGTLGLVVDQVFDTEEVVVKPLAPMLRHIGVFSGNTILGDGSVIMILEPNGIARAAGADASVQGRSSVSPVAAAMARPDDHAPLLMFLTSAGRGPSAVPLGLVARIEELDPGSIEFGSGRPLVQYRGQLMPLIDLDPNRIAGPQPIPVLVFADCGRCVGLMVHEIIDVVEDKPALEVTVDSPGILGSAVIAGRVSDVIDAGYWLTQANQDWFGNAGPSAGERPRLLVVDDSAFFRHLLVPALAAAGYHVTAVESAAAALAMRDGPERPELDAIISDLEMPGMDGLAFARRLRAGGAWSGLPLIALSTQCTAAVVQSARLAGFTDHIGKYDRETLLGSLRRHLRVAQREAA